MNGVIKNMQLLENTSFLDWHSNGGFKTKRLGYMLPFEGYNVTSKMVKSTQPLDKQKSSHAKCKNTPKIPQIIARILYNYIPDHYTHLESNIVKKPKEI